jgi:putative ABC transport system permease protein
MSYAVAERTREIAIRIALGARSHDVLRMIVGRSIALALIGVVSGIAAALAVGPVIRNQLFGVRLMDPATLSAVVLLLVFSATIASLVPARRAARLDPGETLRT